MAGRAHHLRGALSSRVLSAEGVAPQAQRRAAFDNDGLDGARARLVAKVAAAAYEITDADVEAVVREGAHEDEVFELAVCAAVGKAERQLADALRCLDEACAAGSSR